MKKKIAAVICCFLVILIIIIKFVLFSPKAVLSTYEKEYENTKEYEMLYRICQKLADSKEYEKIIKYYPVLLEGNKLINLYKEEIGNNDFLAEVYINDAESVYCIALLHLNKFDEFKDCFLNYSSDLANKLTFYTHLNDELRCSSFSNEQLTVLQDFLIEIYNNIPYDNKDEKSCNANIREYISYLLGRQGADLRVENKS